MYRRACAPSQTTGFPLETAGAAFPFRVQPDLFQQPFGAGGAMEDRCSLSLLDAAALPHTTDPQFAFRKQVGVALAVYYQTLVNMHILPRHCCPGFLSAGGLLGVRSSKRFAYGRRAEPGRRGFSTGFRRYAWWTDGWLLIQCNLQ
jgi:hypothetical protein